MCLSSDGYFSLTKSMPDIFLGGLTRTVTPGCHVAFWTARSSACMFLASTLLNFPGVSHPGFRVTVYGPPRVPSMLATLMSALMPLSPCGLAVGCFGASGFGASGFGATPLSSGSTRRPIYVARTFCFSKDSSALSFAFLASLLALAILTP